MSKKMCEKLILLWLKASLGMKFTLSNQSLQLCYRDSVQLEAYSTSVATLLLPKSTRFNDLKKH